MDIEDIENVRSFLLKLESGRVLRLVEKENYDKLLRKIKELEEENKKNIERYEKRDNEVWERVKQCKNMQTEIDGLYLDKEELEQAYLHEKLAKEEVEELLEDSIPKQKVKDILQKNRNELFSVTYLDDEQYKPYTMQIDRINKIEKELLEDK